MTARNVFGADGPNAAPRLSKTPGRAMPEQAVENAGDILARWCES